MDQNAQLTQPRKRRRPAVSCIACRRRKIKCDRQTPCSQCTNFKSQYCEYASDDGPTRKKPATPPNTSVAASVQTPSQTGESNNFLASAVAARFIQSDPVSIFTSTDANPSGSPKPSNITVADRIRIPYKTLLTRVHDLEDQLSRVQQETGQLPQDKNKLDATAFVRGSISKGRLFGQSHWINAYEQYDKLINLRQFIVSFEEVESVLKECKALARITKSSRSSPLDASPLLSHVPSRETADQLVQLYFWTLESAYRILHVPSFFREYTQYWSSPTTANPMFIVKLLLVMSIGTCFHKDESLRSLTPGWIQAARSFLSGPNEKGRLNISGVQIHCLLLIAKQTTFAGDDLNWISAGYLLRLAMNIGVHRDPKYFPRMPVFQAEMRRRLWWTILELCVQYAFDSGMPPLISFNDFDTALPSNIDDHQINENTKEIPVAKPEDVYTQMSTQLALTRSLQTRISITSLLNGFRNDLTYEEVIELGRSLTAQLRAQSLLLNGYHVFPGSISTPTEFHKSFADVMTRRFLLALHLPFTLLATSDPRYYFSRKVSLDAVLTMCGYTKNSISSSPTIENEDEYYTLLKHRAGGVFRMIMVLGAMTICLENYKQIQEESPLSRELLHKTMAELVDLARRRVEYGETNVQGYLWLSVAKAHIDALENGKPVKEAIQATAKEAVELAHEILKRKVSDMSTAATPVADADEFSWEFLNNTESIFDTPELWLFSEWGNDNETL